MSLRLMCSVNFLIDDGVVARIDENTFLCHTTTGRSRTDPFTHGGMAATEWWDLQVFVQNITGNTPKLLW